MSRIWKFDSIENKHDVYRGEECMRKFCESLRNHAAEIINLDKKKMISLTSKEQKSYEKSATSAKKVRM